MEIFTGAPIILFNLCQCVFTEQSISLQLTFKYLSCIENKRATLIKIFSALYFCVFRSLSMSANSAPFKPQLNPNSPSQASGYRKMDLGARLPTFYLLPTQGQEVTATETPGSRGWAWGTQPVRSLATHSLSRIHLASLHIVNPLPVTSTSTCSSAPHTARLQPAANHRLPQGLGYRDTSFDSLVSPPAERLPALRALRPIIS